MKAVIALADQVAALGRLDPDHRRKRRRQGGDGPLRPQQVAPRRAAVHLASTAPPSPRTCWKASCSATRRAPSPAPWPAASASSRRPTAAPCCWTKSREMDARLQAKLLRAIQEREIDRVGGSKPVKVNIRILATSNRDLAQAVQRRDVPRGPALPPQRREPAPAAAARAPGRHRRRWPITSSRNTPPPTACRRGRCRPRPSARLVAHRWPGNVRELENAMHRAVLLAVGPEIDDDAIRLPDGQPLCGRPTPDAARGPAPPPGRRRRRPRLRRPDGRRRWSRR